jgi:dephospho-CoA kinase
MKNKNFIKEIALERMYRLMDLAIENWKEKPERSIHYLKLMKRIGMRNKVRIPKELKRMYCKKCFSLLLEEKHKKTRVKKKVLLVECKKCGTTKKIFPEKKKQNFVLCITGGIGTGKTTVLRELEKKGFHTLSADKIAKQELNKIKEKIKERFEGTVTKRGIDFRKLAGIVFNNRKKLVELNELVHPLVKRKLKEEIKGEKFTAIEIPLLYEAGMKSLCDKVLVVYCSKEKQIERKLNEMTKKEVLKRISVQMPLKEKIKRADFKIENNGSLNELKEKINELTKKIKS